MLLDTGFREDLSGVARTQTTTSAIFTLSDIAPRGKMKVNAHPTLWIERESQTRQCEFNLEARIATEDDATQWLSLYKLEFRAQVDPNSDTHSILLFHSPSIVLPANCQYRFSLTGGAVGDGAGSGANWRTRDVLHCWITM